MEYFQLSFFILQAFHANFMLQFCMSIKCTTMNTYLYVKPEIQINLNIHATEKKKI